MIRIGLLYPAADPVSPLNWSGTPAGLATGLRRHGVELTPIPVRLPVTARGMLSLAGRWSSRLRATVERSAPMHARRTRLLAGSIASAGHLDALLAMGTEMYGLDQILPVGLKCYTYDDGTLAQMWNHPDSDLRVSGFSAATVSTWIRRQRESSLRADGCFVATCWAAKSFISDYGVEQDRVDVVGIGHNRTPASQARRDWSHPRYLFVGMDWRRKNGPALLQAFRLVRATVPEATLHLVGDIPALDMPGVVNHGLLRKGDTTAQQVLQELYATATCFVLPSRFEPAGISYLEAGSAGLPVISTAEGGAAEILGNGAMCVNPADVAAISQAMLHLSDPEVARDMGIKAAMASENSSWEHVAGRMIARMADARSAFGMRGTP